MNTKVDRNIETNNFLSDTKLANATVWEEYWDASAQAAYWYNTSTNEASWINPNH